MSNDEIAPGPLSGEEEKRRARLAKYTARAEQDSRRYSLFIRRMRLLLPLLAIVILAALIVWPQDSENIIATPEENKEQYQSVRKNELLNPRFESMDKKNQPFTVTANRAIQSDADQDLLTLKSPSGDMLLNSNHRIAIEAENGLYHQRDNTLLLKGSVRLSHDEGYEMTMPELFVHMGENTAKSLYPVRGNGPQGTLEAQGLMANRNENRIVFTGPARLVLKDMSFMTGLTPKTRDQTQGG